MTLYIRPDGQKSVDPGPIPAAEVRKLRRASRGTRRGRGPLRATESHEQTSAHTPVTPKDAA